MKYCHTCGMQVHENPGLTAAQNEALHVCPTSAVVVEAAEKYGGGTHGSAVPAVRDSTAAR